eukprot:g1869.t1
MDAAIFSKDEPEEDLTIVDVPSFSGNNVVHTVVETIEHGPTDIVENPFFKQASTLIKSSEARNTDDDLSSLSTSTVSELSKEKATPQRPPPPPPPTIPAGTANTIKNVSDNEQQKENRKAMIDDTSLSPFKESPSFYANTEDDPFTTETLDNFLPRHQHLLSPGMKMFFTEQKALLLAFTEKIKNGLDAQKFAISRVSFQNHPKYQQEEVTRPPVTSSSSFSKGVSFSTPGVRSFTNTFAPRPTPVTLPMTSSQFSPTLHEVDTFTDNQIEASEKYHSMTTGTSSSRASALLERVRQMRARKASNTMERFAEQQKMKQNELKSLQKYLNNSKKTKKNRETSTMTKPLRLTITRGSKSLKKVNQKRRGQQQKQKSNGKGMTFTTTSQQRNKWNSSTQRKESIHRTRYDTHKKFPSSTRGSRRHARHLTTIYRQPLE